MVLKQEKVTIPRELAAVFSRPKAQQVKVLNSRPPTIDFEKLFQDKITDFWYMIIVTVQYYKKGEIWNSRSCLQILLSTLIKLMELTEDPKILLLETNKRIEEFLSDEQIDLLKIVSPAYDRDQISQSFKKILEVFPEICQKTADKYNYQYRKDIEDKIKPKLLKLLKKDF